MFDRPCLTCNQGELLRPTWGAILRTVDIPPLGGDTIWADGHAVYENLSGEIQEKIENMYVVHDFQSALERVGLEYPIVAHRLVRVHPETGEKIVWVNFSQKPSIVAGLHYAVVNYGDYPRELERVLIEDFDALPHY